MRSTHTHANTTPKYPNPPETPFLSKKGAVPSNLDRPRFSPPEITTYDIA